MKRYKIEIDLSHLDNTEMLGIGYVILGNQDENMPIRSLDDLVRLEILPGEAAKLNKADFNYWKAHRTEPNWSLNRPDYLRNFVEQLAIEAYRQLVLHWNEYVDINALSLDTLETIGTEFEDWAGYLDLSRDEEVDFAYSEISEAIGERIDEETFGYEEAYSDEYAENTEEQEVDTVLKFLSSGRRAGFIYLLKADNGYWKIGYASNPHNRIKTFGVKLPFDVQYEHLIATNNMPKAEAMLHQRFASKRVGGEWFNLNDEDISWIKTLKKLDI